MKAVQALFSHLSSHCDLLKDSGRAQKTLSKKVRTVFDPDALWP